MREFRAKTTKKENGKHAFNNVWVEGDLVVSRDKYYIHPRANAFQVDNELAKLVVMHEVIPETVGQFTGLFDCTKWEELSKKQQKEFLSHFNKDGKPNTKEDWKGKRIFEGDIIKICSSNWWCGYTNNQLEKERCRVYYNEKTACFEFNDGKFNLSFDEYLYNDSEKKYSLEVIGNIIDNKELLDKGE